jgi:hypothetical protein
MMSNPSFLTQDIEGWYFLLNESVGKCKHLHVQENWRPLLSIPDTVGSECMHPNAEEDDVMRAGSLCGELCIVIALGAVSCP